MRALMLLMLALPATAMAGSLGDYGAQKHGDRDKVTKATCVQAYVARCTQSCAAGDTSCKARCEAEAPAFCAERRSRQRRKTAEVVAKGASVGAGAAAVAIQNAIVRSRRDGQDLGAIPEPGPYAIRWNRPTFIAEVGGGALTDGTGAGTAHLQQRFGPVGLGLQSSYLTDGEDWLSETDLGPMVYMASPNIVFGLQPSLLVSVFDGDSTFGAGARSYTSLHVERVQLHFDPMLGLINGQWNYHLRVGASYRLTPVVYGRLSYDYRDILDLTDLDISQASLQGVMLTVGMRFN